jgi:hypothetical protein
MPKNAPVTAEVDMVIESNESNACALAAAMDSLERAWAGKPGARPVPLQFAKIIVGLFPPWFDFASDKFAIQREESGLRLTITDQRGGVIEIQTSPSRCMTCVVDIRGSVEKARIDMHYEPSADQLRRARSVIQLALAKLFPQLETIPSELSRQVPEGRVFPKEWCLETWE